MDTNTTTAPSNGARPMAEEADFLQLKAIDHVHWWVGNAKQTMYYWWKAFGFKPVAYSGLETGNRSFASYVLESGTIRFVVSAAYGPSSEIAAHQLVHGDGVKVIALAVDDVAQAHRETTARGGVSAWVPREERDEHGDFANLGHSHLRRSAARFRRPQRLPRRLCADLSSAGPAGETAGLAALDHMVGNVQLGKMNHWVNFYHQVMGFRQLIHFDDQDISTEYSALMSKVMQNGSGRIKFPINEPADGKRRSQIEEYLDYYMGPGVQHVAMATGDILQTVRTLKSRGIEFLRVPEAYYDQLPERVGQIKENMATIRELGILVDRDDEGYLLQIFSRPLQDRPTAFIEVIERHGSRGFGKGNFKALFEALEIEQERRGEFVR